LADAIDLSLLRKGAHSPSYFALTRSMGGSANGQGGQPDLVDFCIPCNPYFPTPGMFQELQGGLETILKYYPSDADSITSQLASTLRLNPATVAMGNGSTELITWIDHLLIRESMATPVPTFGRWTDQPLETGKRVDMFQLREDEDFEFNVDAFIAYVRARGSRVAVVCNPNNPDGGYLPRSEIVRMLDELADLDLVVVDESFIDFVDAEVNGSVAEEATIRSNVIVLKSLGKNFGLHGVRFGYLVANPALARIVRQALPKWNLNSFAEIVVFMLAQHHEEYRESLRLLAQDRWDMSQALLGVPGLTVFSSQANFLLIRLPDGADGVDLRDHLISRHGVFVRECGNKLGITSQFLRLVVRPQADVQRLVAGMMDYSGRQESSSNGYAHQNGTIGQPYGAVPGGYGQEPAAAANGYAANGYDHEPSTNGYGYQHPAAHAGGNVAGYVGVGYENPATGASAPPFARGNVTVASGAETNGARHRRLEPVDPTGLAPAPQQRWAG
jgi:histidinol-phosphate/aromatic aminotransferase/cobyric acid decarboxylase-like protein